MTPAPRGQRVGLGASRQVRRDEQQADDVRRVVVRMGVRSTEIAHDVPAVLHDTPGEQEVEPESKNSPAARNRS
jgi:hypothetical protein